MRPAPRTRVPRRPVHGVLLLDKPLGWSSHDALQKVKGLLRAEKAGHTGTLDPLASGVLPLCFGAATKFSQVQLDADKCYEARLQLGQTTASGDAEGEVLGQRPVPRLSQADLDALAQRFSGSIEQIPPMTSALKKDGRPLYAYARAGLEVERTPRRVQIHTLKLSFAPDAPAQDALILRATVSKGTYIRTLGADLGEALGCGAHLRALRRLRSGTLDVAQAITLPALEALDDAQRLALLQPLASLLTGWPQVVLGATDALRFSQGLSRRGPWPQAAQVAVFDAQGGLLGSASAQADVLQPSRLLSEQERAQIAAAHPPDGPPVSA